MKVLLFAASLRKDSLNRKLIRQASEILKVESNIQIDLADFHEFAMPLYDGDLEEKLGLPAGAKELVRRVLAADAVVISTPEYNGGITGTLKNALDWVSRSKPISFGNKPLLLLGASPGGFGAIRGLWHTRVPFEVVGSFVYPDMFGLSQAHQAFNESGDFVDTKNTERLTKLLQSYLKFSASILTDQQ